MNDELPVPFYFVLALGERNRALTAQPLPHYTSDSFLHHHRDLFLPRQILDLQAITRNEVPVRIGVRQQGLPHRTTLIGVPDIIIIRRAGESVGICGFILLHPGDKCIRFNSLAFNGMVSVEGIKKSPRNQSDDDKRNGTF